MLKIICKLINLKVFFKALIANPKATGAIMPSSKRLAFEIASHAYLPENGLLIELGAGTGVITEALLQQNICPENLIAVERSAELVKNLRLRFPGLQIIEGNAANLREMLGNSKNRVNTIVSSLPLRSLPKPLVAEILETIEAILPIGGKYIQYTYSFSENYLPSLTHCQKIFSKRIWLNFPPARVDIFIRIA